MKKIDIDTAMNHRIKRFLFTYYALISVAVFGAGILLFMLGSLTWQEFASIAAAAFAFAFGVQKQNLEEVRLFKDLFERFNSRYDELDKDLNRINRVGPAEGKEFSSEDRDTLFRYFNLCGEEYLYARQGLIRREVWAAWKMGMEFFRRNPRIRQFWDDDLKSGSYYGLTFEE